MNSWKETELRKVLHVKHGFAFKGEFFSNIGTQIIITPGNFNEAGGFKYTPGKEKYYTTEYPKEYLCKKGDLIVAMTEQAAGLLGSVALVPVDNVFLHNQRIGLLTFDRNSYDKLFLYYLFRTKSVREQIALSSSGSKVKHTSPERIYDVKVKIPSLSIQKEIGRILYKLDSKIELNNKINQELEQMSKTLYDYWFVQFDFPYDFAQGKPNEQGNPYKSSGGKMLYSEELKREIPAGWEVKELSEIANITMGQSPSGSSYNENEDGEIFFQGSTDFGWRFPSVRQYTTEPSRMSDIGDILLSVRAPVGTLNIADNICCIGRGLAALNSKDDATSYLFYVMLYFKQIFDRRNSAGTTFGSITKDDLFSLELVYPTKDLLMK